MNNKFFKISSRIVLWSMIIIFILSILSFLIASFPAHVLYFGSIFYALRIILMITILIAIGLTFLGTIQGILFMKNSAYKEAYNTLAKSSLLVISAGIFSALVYYVLFFATLDPGSFPQWVNVMLFFLFAGSITGYLVSYITLIVSFVMIAKKKRATILKAISVIIKGLPILIVLFYFIERMLWLNSL